MRINKNEKVAVTGCKQYNTMKNNNQNGRREFLSTSLKGSLLVMAGMSSATVLQSFAPATLTG